MTKKNNEYTSKELNDIIALEKMTIEYLINNKEDYKPMPDQMHRTSRTYGLENSIGYNLSCLLNLPVEVLNYIYRSLAYQLIKNNVKITNKGLISKKQKITVGNTVYYFKLYPRDCFGDKTLRIVFSDYNGILPSDSNCNVSYKFQLNKIDEVKNETK